MYALSKVFYLKRILFRQLLKQLNALQLLPWKRRSWQVFLLQYFLTQAFSSSPGKVNFLRRFLVSWLISFFVSWSLRFLVSCFLFSLLFFFFSGLLSYSYAFFVCFVFFWFLGSCLFLVFLGFVFCFLISYMNSHLCFSLVCLTMTEM